jgi:hypothetical protein
MTWSLDCLLKDNKIKHRKSAKKAKNKQTKDYTRSQKELMAGASARKRRAVQVVPLKPSTEATNQQTFCVRV